MFDAPGVPARRARRARASVENDALSMQEIQDHDAEVRADPTGPPAWRTRLNALLDRLPWRRPATDQTENDHDEDDRGGDADWLPDWVDDDRAEDGPDIEDGETATGRLLRWITPREFFQQPPSPQEVWHASGHVAAGDIPSFAPPSTPEAWTWANRTERVLIFVLAVVPLLISWGVLWYAQNPLRRLAFYAGCSALIVWFIAADHLGN